MIFFNNAIKKKSYIRADSRIRSQDRGRRGARPARREEGKRLAVTNPVCWVFAGATTRTHLVDFCGEVNSTITLT